MRTTAVPSMLDIIAKNNNNRTINGNFYEIATEYTKTTADKLPIEKDKLLIGLYGEGYDFYTLKGMIETVLDKISRIYMNPQTPVIIEQTLHGRQRYQRKPIQKQHLIIAPALNGREVPEQNPEAQKACDVRENHTDRRDNEVRTIAHLAL